MVNMQKMLESSFQKKHKYYRDVAKEETDNMTQ